MPRPESKRRICLKPKSCYFKPQGIPMKDLEEVVLYWDEMEALRLKNLKEMDQLEAASQMRISQSTFQRIMTRANKKVAEALLLGKALKIVKDKE